MQAKEIYQSIEVDGIKRTIKLYVFTTGFADLDGFLGLDTYHAKGSSTMYKFTKDGYNFTISNNIKLTSAKLDKVYNFNINADTLNDINVIINNISIFEELFTYNGKHVDISFKGVINGKVGLLILVKTLGLALSWKSSVDSLGTVHSFAKNGRDEFIREIEDRASRITVFSKIAGEYHAGYYRQLKEINDTFNVDSYSMVITNYDGTQKTEFLNQFSLESAIKRYICANEKSDIKTSNLKPTSEFFSRYFGGTPK